MDSSDAQHDTERGNRLAFNFFMGAMAFALLAGIWMLIQAAFF